ncbi:MAG: HutP family protein [Acidaminococcaceae bacterium]|nr:HutP family protein [Acidaminococcaceae bacterium]
MDYLSLDIGRAALQIAMSKTREEENKIKKDLLAKGLRTAAVDFGGEFIDVIPKITERAVVAAQREGLVSESHVGAGAVSGATHTAIGQISNLATGFNIGGKIGIARWDEHLCVAIYAGVGVLNLNEICVGLSHRTLSKDM